MGRSDAMSDLTGIDHSRVGRIAERFVAHGETIAISESSAGGLISAALLSVPGASAYFLGGGVIYTRKAMGALLELTPAKLEGLRSATEPMACLLAETVRIRLDAG
jgi:nicotinamide-nucleotide amidase